MRKNKKITYPRYRVPAQLVPKTGTELLRSAILKRKREIKKSLAPKSSDELQDILHNLKYGQDNINSKLHAQMTPVVIQAIEEMLSNRRGDK